MNRTSVVLLLSQAAERKCLDAVPDTVALAFFAFRALCLRYVDHV